MYRMFGLMLFGVCVLSSGCASIINGTIQEVSVSSNPSGAKVQADGNDSGETPAKIKLKRKTDHVLVITKDGYEQEQRNLMHVISGAVCGNILAGGLIGWGVDAATGAQYKLVPGTVHVDLKPAKEGTATAMAPATQISAEDRLKELEKLHEQKSITDEEYEANKQLILKTLTGEGAKGQSTM